MNMNSEDYLNVLYDLRKKMHDPRGSKAAVMIGSGFSRNARPRFGGGRQFPLWKDLTARLVDGLYVNPEDRKRVLESAGATSSALRLSEEYEAAFGRSALIEVVRQETSDDDFEPSELHGKLVDLPWADIFTTNYDRLIERAAHNSPGRTLRKNRYDIVTQTADIPLARHPRIVKLHGTLPDLANLVLTEEDFRCYATQQGAFVNAVRASMSENAFCLLGFSGDDPNFLAWSGWIRDTLRESTPTVFLFCTSPLASFKRKLLEQRNIVPIPIGALFGTENIAESIEKLLNFLSDDNSLSYVAWNRPPDSVQLHTDNSGNSEDPVSESEIGWIESALLWRRNRLEYKGWEVLHRRSLDKLWDSTDIVLNNFTVDQLQGLSTAERLLILRELLWRLSMCLVPIWDITVNNVIDPLVLDIRLNAGNVFRELLLQTDDEETKISVVELREAYRYVICQLIRHAREIGDKERFQRLSSFLMELDGVTREDLCFVEHQAILNELGSLRADSARKRLRAWDVSGLPAIWTARRCGLLMEVGEVEVARDDLIRLIDSLFSTKFEPVIDYRRHSVEAIALYQMQLVKSWDEGVLTPPKQDSSKSDDSLSNDDLSTLDESESPKEPSGQQGNKQPEESNAEPGDFEIRRTRRLRELNRIGCDPSELLYLFNDLFEHYSIDEADSKPTESESFDIEQTSYHLRAGDNKQHHDAYRTVRFIEDSGLPISILGGIQLNTPAKPPFIAAASVIAKESGSEATGLVLRSRDEKLTKAWLSRQTLAMMPDELVKRLFHQSQDCFERSLSGCFKLDRPPNQDNQWWERQLRFATIVLGRLVPRLLDADLKSISKKILSLSGAPEVWKVRGVAGDIGDLIRRLAKCLPNSDLLALAPELIRLPVPGDSDAGFPETSNLGWIDPLSQFDFSDTHRHKLNLTAQVSPAIDRIAKASGIHRRNLVLRMVSLLHCGFLDHNTRMALRDALFQQVDDNGFPKDTGCYDSLILGLPQGKEDETKLYQAAYVTPKRKADLGYWGNLARSVYRDRSQGIQGRRSVQWTSNDLEFLISRTAEWSTQIRGELDGEKHESPLSAFWGNRQSRERQQAIREWLHFVGDVVLLSEHFQGKLKDDTTAAIQVAKQAQICIVRLLPLMCARGLENLDEAKTQIREAFLNAEETVVRQACSAIVYWGRLAASGQLQWSAGLESLLGSSVLLQHDSTLAIVLTATRELLEVYPRLDSPRFFEDLIDGLKSLARKTSYGPDARMSIEEKIRIRIACAKLVRQLENMNIVHAVTTQWLKSAQEDNFAEVRRAASN